MNLVKYLSKKKVDGEGDNKQLKRKDSINPNSPRDIGEGDTKEVSRFFDVINADNSAVEVQFDTKLETLINNINVQMKSNLDFFQYQINSINKSHQDIVSGMQAENDKYKIMLSEVSKFESNNITTNDNFVMLSSKISDINDNVTQLGVAVNNLASQLINVNDKVNMVNDRVSDAKDGNAQLNIIVENLSNVVANNYSDLNKLIDGLGAQLNNVGHVINGLSGQVNGLSGQVTSIGGTVSGLSSTVDGLNGTVTGLAGTVNGIIGELAGVQPILSSYQPSLNLVISNPTISSIWNNKHRSDPMLV